MKLKTDVIDRYKILYNEREFLVRNISRLRRKKKRSNKQVNNYTKAINTLEQIIRIAQNNLKASIEGVITSSIQSVFDRDIKFVFDIENTKPMLIEDGEEFSPNGEIGGSLIDILSITLRIVLMLMIEPATRPILFLDEPFKHSGTLQKEMAKVIQRMSREVQIQFVITTHSTAITQVADRHFTVTRKGKISKVMRRRR